MPHPDTAAFAPTDPFTPITAPASPASLPPPPSATPTARTEPVVFTGIYGSAPPYAPEAPLPPAGATADGRSARDPRAWTDPYAAPWDAPPPPTGASPHQSAPWGAPGSASMPLGMPGAMPGAPPPAMPGYRLPPGPPTVPPGPPTHGAGWPPYPAGPATVAIPPRRRSPAVWVAALVVIVAFMAGSLAFLATSSTKQALTGAPPVRTVPAAPTTPTTTPGASGQPGGSSTDPATGGAQSNDPSTWTDVAAAINPGVVNIESRLPQGIGAGTGIVLTQEGRVLTNNHVVDGATEIQVTVASTGEFYSASIVGTDAAHDIAVLQMDDASDLATIPLGDSDGVQVSDPVAAIGNAGGRGGTPQIVTGKVVALHTSVTASDQDGSNAETLTDMIQVDAKVVPGDSGGPLADEHGKVIGINTAASASSAGTGRGRTRTTTPEGYAIPINRALAIAEQLAKGGSTPSTAPKRSTPASNRGYIGVEVSQDTSAVGATVSGVKAGSGAQQAGVRAGDVITEIDGTPIEAPSDLTAALSGKSAGTKVEVTWETSTGQQKQATITLQAG